MTSLIYIIGILVTVLLFTLWVEVTPALPAGQFKRFVAESHEAAPIQLPGWRGWLSALDGLAARFAPLNILTRTRADLYFAQLDGKWESWNEIQVTSLRAGAAAGGFILGLVVFEELIPSLLAGVIGWQAPVFSLSGAARRARRRFQAQLPEFIQLVAAQMAAGVSLDEALRRVAQTNSLVAKWVRYVIQMAQGRTILVQMQKEAQESLMPDLISLSVQLDFIRMGTAQQELMAQMAERIAGEYQSQAEQRAEKVGSELIVPMVLLYFIPFVVTILALLGYPLIASLGR